MLGQNKKDKNNKTPKVLVNQNNNEDMYISIPASTSEASQSAPMSHAAGRVYERRKKPGVESVDSLVTTSGDTRPKSRSVNKSIKAKQKPKDIDAEREPKEPETCGQVLDFNINLCDKNLIYFCICSFEML